MSRLARTLRAIRVRPRLAVSTIVLVLTGLLVPLAPASTRVLAAWVAGSSLYLALAWTMMARGGAEDLRQRARVQDDGAAAVLVLTVLASIATVGAILAELTGLKDLAPGARPGHLALAGATILCSWALIHTAFALHYAHTYYRAPAGVPGSAPLQFPGAGDPGYVDFLYFAFVIGSTAQTADVGITSARMRRLAMMHGVIAFFFNTTLLALAVNAAAATT